MAAADSREASNAIRVIGNDLRRMPRREMEGGASKTVRSQAGAWEREETNENSRTNSLPRRFGVGRVRGGGSSLKCNSI